MSDLHVRGVSKRFGAVAALEEVEFTAESGTCVAFLGPSGCGKTTLLRIIAGLDRPDAGSVHLGEEEITQLPAAKRGIGMVFQSLALFPHLDVGENIAYALRLKGVSRERRRVRARALLELLRLPGLEARRITQLSGGQRQRVAIARALAAEPRLFLLDEPLSALDAKLREALQVELRQLQKRLGITTILVTHDRREAMTLSDRIVVLAEGRIQQVGAPLDIYRKPANRFVAEFIGACNFLPSRLERGRFRVGESWLLAPHSLAEGAEVLLAIRPEAVRLHSPEEPRPNSLALSLSFLRDVGDALEAHLSGEGIELVAALPPQARQDLRIGQTLRVELPAESLLPFPSPSSRQAMS